MIYDKRPVRYSSSRVHTLVNWAHVHHEFEIVYAIKSDCTAICDGVEYQLNSGDLFIAFPHHIHSYRYTDEIEGQLLIFAPEEFGGFAEAFKTKSPLCPVVHNCGDKIKRLIDEIDITDRRAQYGEQKLLGYMTVLLSEIFARLELCDHTRSNTDNVQRILEYCSVNYMNKITLDVISRDLYINRYHISHIFNDTLGISITDYINTLRIIQAEILLKKDNYSMAEIAQTIGFSNQRTFNRVFLAQKGMTPSEYRRLQNTEL